MPNCVECGLYFKDQGCPAKRCPKCGKECHDLQYEQDEMEWDECDECPYIPDTINYEALERDYPSDLPLNNSNSISPKSQLSKDNLSTCGVDQKQTR